MGGMTSPKADPPTVDMARRDLQRWLAAVAFLAILVRLLLWIGYAPVAYGDTPSYWRLAASVANGFERYDGTRTPGYPAFLAAVGDETTAWMAQMGLGVLTTFLFFGLGWLATGRAHLAGLAALAHTLNLGQLFFEANLITETLSTFWVAAAMLIVFLWLTRPARRSLWLAFLLSSAVSLAWLTRPIFVFLPAVMFPFLLLAPPRPESAGPDTVKPGSGHPSGGLFNLPRPTLSLSNAAAFLVPAALALFLWSNFIHSRFRVWSLSAMTGYHLVQHSGHLFEYLPDEQAALRDTYLKYRDAQIARRGTQTNAIWDAIPELQRATGMNFYRLSRHLTRVSVELILAHPGPYLRNVLEGWWLFWRAPVFWSADALRWPALADFLASAIVLQRIALVAANLIFMVTSLAGLAFRGFRQRLGINPPLWCIAATVWAASILQTLLDHGDNPRFLVPMQSLVVLWTIVILSSWLGSYFRMRRAVKERSVTQQISNQ